ncbi:MAG: hypothetical protein HOP19_09875 [Acidobacteria bacterium]|nr:hypothetical protein [Acidobacteriota bacterium]
MRQAKLIKRGEQPTQKETPVKSAKETQTTFVRNTIKTAQAWVKDFQTNERTDARQQFAALFA